MMTRILVVNEKKESRALIYRNEDVVSGIYDETFTRRFKMDWKVYSAFGEKPKNLINYNFFLIVTLVWRSREENLTHIRDGIKSILRTFSHFLLAWEEESFDLESEEKKGEEDWISKSWNSAFLILLDMKSIKCIRLKYFISLNSWWCSEKISISILFIFFIDLKKYIRWEEILFIDFDPFLWRKRMKMKMNCVARKIFKHGRLYLK